MLRRAVPGLLALCLAVSGCGGDAGTRVDGLTSGDVRSMIEALDEVGAFSFNLSLASGRGTTSGAMPAQSAHASIIATRHVPIDLTVPCIGGGSAHLTGLFESIGQGADVAYDISLEQRYNGCAANLHNARQFTFDGSPSNSLELHYSSNALSRLTKMHGTFRGTFSWMNVDGTAGSCSADLALSSTHLAATEIYTIDTGVAGQITGLICSRNMDVHY